MNELLIFESLYWLVKKTIVPMSELDTKTIILDNLGHEIVKLKPMNSNSLPSKTEGALSEDASRGK